jgi:hypothetical protein
MFKEKVGGVKTERPELKNVWSIYEQGILW